jgi:hypothetical protein
MTKALLKVTAEAGAITSSKPGFFESRDHAGPQDLHYVSPGWE